jgi:hypothetical protein
VFLDSSIDSPESCLSSLIAVVPPPLCLSFFPDFPNLNIWIVPESEEEINDDDELEKEIS